MVIPEDIEGFKTSLKVVNLKASSVDFLNLIEASETF
jgi:hypothetical protein